MFVWKRALILIAAGLSIVAATPTKPASARAASTAYDGAWQLSFLTRTGACDLSYNFNVNILGGVITHPNLVRFRGYVSRNGATRASVAVQSKTASGYGRLFLTNGRGSWNGYSDGARCSGHWTARKI